MTTAVHQRTVDPVLAVRDLEVSFTYDGVATAVVRSASFEVGVGETVGLVGESGSGKTVTAMAALGLVGHVGGRVTGGSITFEGRELAGLAEREWSTLRGSELSMIFQQPVRSLNPALTVGEQIAEVVRRHRGASRREAWAEAVAMLDRVHIARSAERAGMYPHELSGGMCQRVMIASALVCRPRILVADEPTTALDVTVQKHILELLEELKDETGVGILLITHDMGVIAQTSDRVAVMYAGEVVEQADVLDLFRSPRHPYTEGLLRSMPERHVHRLGSVPGHVPSPTAMPAGCRFHPRCASSVEGTCTTGTPVLQHLVPGRVTRCVRAGDIYVELSR